MENLRDQQAVHISEVKCVFRSRFHLSHSRSGACLCNMAPLPIAHQVSQSAAAAQEMAQTPWTPGIVDTGSVFVALLAFLTFLPVAVVAGVTKS